MPSVPEQPSAVRAGAESQAPPRGEEFRNDVRRAPGELLPPALLRELTALDAWRGYRAVALTLAIALGAVTLAATVWTPWIVITAVIVIATRQHALFVLAHEAAHYRLSPHRGWNDALGRLLGSLAGISMCSYRVIHRLHHNHLYGAQDPDIALHGGYPRGRGYLLRKLAADLGGITAYKTYKYFFGVPALDTRTPRAQRPLDDTSPTLREAARRDRRGVIALQIGMPLAIAVAFGVHGLIKYLVLWVLPAVSVLQAILRVRAIAEHGAPAGLESPFAAARTNMGGVLARLVLFPHHVNYHVEHHLLPAVPHYHLPRLHAELRARGLLEGAEVRPFAHTWRRVFAPRGSAGETAWALPKYLRVTEPRRGGERAGGSPVQRLRRERG